MPPHTTFRRLAMRHSTVLIGLVVLAGCADLSPTDELTAAERRWQAWGPASYDLAIFRGCECLRGDVIVRVRGGAIEAVVYSDGTPVPFDQAGAFPDVEGFFGMIRAEIRDGHVSDVDYDPTSGYPRRILLDFDGSDVNGADGETTYTVTLRAP
jgi:hypothetical protein